MWLLIKRISGNSSINKRRKTEEEAKTSTNDSGSTRNA
jgi:hypothetical protein